MLQPIRRFHFLIFVRHTLRFRSDFRGDWIDSYVDGSKIRYYPKRLRAARVHVSTCGYLCFSVGLCIHMYYLARYSAP